MCTCMLYSTSSDHTQGVMMENDKFNFRWPDWLRDAVKNAAKQKGVTVSEYIKDAIKAQLLRDEGSALETR